VILLFVIISSSGGLWVTFMTFTAFHRVICNHSGALHFRPEMHSYFQGELTHQSVVGPFTSVPFCNGMAMSPLNTVPKKDTTDCRVILDLSWPPGTSVNDGILPNVVDGSEFPLMSRIERKCCSISTSYLVGLSDIFILLHI